MKMFATLLESRANKDHSVTGGIASISAHAAVIGIAVIATARAHPGVRAPLRSSGIQGKVVARFVVDERGMAEADSVQFVSSDNRLFEDAVRVALRRMRFAPAEIGGRKVRQLVQMPFVFTLGR